MYCRLAEGGIFGGQDAHKLAGVTQRDIEKVRVERLDDKNQEFVRLWFHEKYKVGFVP